MPIKYSVCVLSGGAEVLMVGPVLQTSSGLSGLAANTCRWGSRRGLIWPHCKTVLMNERKYF